MSGQLIMHYAHFSQEDISKELVYGFIPPMLFFWKDCLSIFFDNSSLP